jgi:hypothetical protein
VSAPCRHERVITAGGRARWGSISEARRWDAITSRRLAQTRIRPSSLLRPNTTQTPRPGGTSGSLALAWKPSVRNAPRPNSNIICKMHVYGCSPCCCCRPAGPVAAQSGLIRFQESGMTQADEGRSERGSLIKDLRERAVGAGIKSGKRPAARIWPRLKGSRPRLGRGPVLAAEKERMAPRFQAASVMKLLVDPVEDYRSPYHNWLKQFHPW